MERTASLAAWVTDLVLRVGGDEQDVAAIMKVDAGGTAPRELVVEELRARAGLTAPADELLTSMRAGIVRRITPDVRVLSVLARARDAGWTCVVVSNGMTAQQIRKIRRAGLDARLDAWLISEEAGVRKPDPRIFDLAAQRVGADLEDAWMIGDSPTADIGGAQRLRAALGLAQPRAGLAARRAAGHLRRLLPGGGRRARPRRA